jgi:hypothetical protein
VVGGPGAVRRLVNGRSCPWIDTAPGPKRPILGPMTMIAASAAQPPTEWTTVDPAKSTNPSSLSQPSELPLGPVSDPSPHAQ